MSVTLARTNYGKSRVRLLKVTRLQDRHEVRDLTVGIQYEGDYEAAPAGGEEPVLVPDESKLLPTDAMRDAVYALAKRHPVDQIEHFGIALIEHFLDASPQASRVRVEVVEQPWEHLTVSGVAHRHAFHRAGVEKRVAILAATRASMTIESGVEDLAVMKTAGSGFEASIKDHVTTLRETSDRVFATAIRAIWRYGHSDIAFRLHWQAVRQVILRTFAEHETRSVQQTLYAIGQAALEQCAEIVEMRLSLPTQPHALADLTAFGLENRNEVFIPAEEPYGLVEAVVRRAGVLVK
jgi:urate oxidase